MFELVCFLLSAADQSALHTHVALCLSASLIILALAAAFFLFKVDLLLAHRKLLRHFAKRGNFPLSVGGLLFCGSVYLYTSRNSLVCTTE